MASVQRLKANVGKDAVWEATGTIASTGSVFEIGTLSGGTNLVSFPTSGSGGVTVSADGMTANPELSPEAGYITIDVNGTGYQIPIYAA